MPKKYTNDQRMVAMNDVTATNRKKCVAPNKAGEAVDMIMIPNN